MLELPLHIGRLRIVSAEQVALAMAGLSDSVNNIEQAVNGNYTGYREALVFKETIMQAIKLKEIIPLQAYKLPNANYELSEFVRFLIDYDDIKIDTALVDANFLAKDIWPWAENELSDNLPWHSDSLNTPVYQVQNKFSEPGEKIAGSRDQIDVFEDEGPGVFRGKNTALMLIAGLAIALEKSGESFKRSGKMNKSAIINAAEHAISSYGDGVNVTDKALRDWLDMALKQHASKLR